MAQSLDKARQFLIDEYLKALTEGKIPWAQGWESMGPRSFHNGASGRPYHGINQLILYLVSEQKGYEDPRWYTYKQAKDLGYQVRKGEKSAPITFASLFYEKKAISFEDYNKLSKEEQKKVFWKTRAYSVFNAQQIDGVPERAPVPTHDIHGSELVEKIQKGLEVQIEFRGDQPCYNPLADKVIVPKKEHFISEEEYNATVLHELCHSTGHPSRMNRDLSGSFGSENYAKEELRAEIGSSFLMQSLQLPMPQSHIDNHKAYIQSWIKVLENEPGELFKAIHDAEKIESYALDKGGIDKEALKEAVREDKEVSKESSKQVSERKVKQSDRDR